MNRGSVQRQVFKIPAQQLGSYAEITALADAYLLAHRAELFAQAEASPIVQNLRSQQTGPHREVAQ